MLSSISEMSGGCTCSGRDIHRNPSCRYDVAPSLPDQQGWTDSHLKGSLVIIISKLRQHESTFIILGR